MLVVGAGPAGASVSIALSQKGINHILLDKTSFPRDKICGDALSGKVVHLLRKMDPSWPALLAQEAESLPSNGVIFVAPNGKALEIPFKHNPDPDEPAPGFVSPRTAFDHWLLQRSEELGGNRLFQTEVERIERLNKGFRVLTSSAEGEKEILCKMLLGAGGDRCPVAKWSGIKKMEPEHYCAGIRAYYTGVKDLHDKGFIELHFIPEFLPGYLWIFPMQNGKANVGAGILSSEAAKRKFNLRSEMLRVLDQHPMLAPRFANATLNGKVEGWGLPLGSKRRPLSGDGFMLCGDSASLIDPFTGEGIGNAMLSGYHAGEIAASALAEGNLSAGRLSAYDEKVYSLLADELRTSRILQKLTKHQWLFNLVVNKAVKSESLRYTISAMFEDVAARKKFKSPMFYLRLLTGN